MPCSASHIDMDSLDELREVMEDDFSLLINTYLDDAQKKIIGLHQAVGDNDADAIRMTAHSFKGSCSNIGALHLVELLQTAENNGLNQQMDSMPVLVEQIEAEYGEVKQILGQQIN